MKRHQPDLILTSDWTRPETLAKVTPEGATALTLHGLDHLAQIGDNLCPHRPSRRHAGCQGLRRGLRDRLTRTKG